MVNNCPFTTWLFSIWGPAPIPSRLSLHRFGVRGLSLQPQAPYPFGRLVKQRRSLRGRLAPGQRQGKKLPLLTTGASSHHHSSQCRRSKPESKLVRCVSRSHGKQGDVTSPDLSSPNIDMNPSSRSRTHQNQSRKGEHNPLSLPLPHRCATGERGKKKEDVWSNRNRWLAPPAWEVSALRA